MTDIAITLNGADITGAVVSWEINHPGAWVMDARLNIAGMEFWADCDPTEDAADLRIVITVDSTAYAFLIEERSETVSLDGVDFEIWGRSRQAYLGEKFAQTINDSSQANPWEDADTTVSDVLTAIGDYCPYSVTINWEVDDYAIPSGALSVENQYPIDVIKSLADAVGAELIAEADGSLTVKTYVMAEGDLPASVASYTDVDDIVSLSCRIESTKGQNAVVVYGFGVEDTDPANWLGAEVLDDGPYYISNGYYQYTVRLYFYMETLELPTIFSDNAALQIDKINTLAYYNGIGTGLNGTGIGVYGRISRTETLRLAWGRGQTPTPDTTGETLVTGDEEEPFEYADHTWESFFVDYRVSCPTQGRAEISFYLADKSAESNLSIEFTYPDGTSSRKPFMAVVIQSDPPHDGIVRVRLYWWHETYVSSSIETASLNDSAYIALLANGEEHITETVRLIWGKGQTSKPDTLGNMDVIDPTHEDDALADVSATYNTPYTEFNVTAPVGDHELLFYFPDNSASASLSLTIVEEDPGPEVIDHPILVQNHYTKEPIAGAEVRLDGVSQGVTGSDGILTLEDVTRGQTYALLITATGFVDSDEDLISNDSITIP